VLVRTPEGRNKELDMNVIACIKQVPATEAKIKVDSSGKDIDRTNLSYVVNPYCEFGVEEALRIKERLGKGEVTVISLGPARVAEALRTCLAMGADKAIHLRDEAAEIGDALTTGLVLAAAIKRFSFDLILFGKQAVDDDQGAVGIQAAEHLGLPHVGVINKLEIDPEKRLAVANRQIEGGIEVVETRLPAVFTCQKGLNEPRYASLPGIMKAKQKPLEEMVLDSLGLDPETVGTAGAKVKLLKMAPPPARGGGRILEGPAPEAVRELVRLLREEAKFF
jgi:electron transfer flavoprotein beta subunit